MPVIHIRGTQSRASLATRRSLAHVAEAAAEPAGTSVSDVWCTFQPLAATTIGDRAPLEAEAILYVDVVMNDRGRDVTKAVLEATARAAAQSFHTKLDNVWARYTPIEPGTVFAGGEMV